MPIRIYNCDQRSTGWHSIRAATPVTASIIGVILRDTTTKTYNDLVYEKASQGRTSPNNIKSLDHGIKCEAFALERLRRSFKIYDVGFVTNTKYPNIGVSPDGVIAKYKGRPTLLEIKCPYSREITGKIPKPYYHQMQLQMLICDIPQCLYAEFKFHPETHAYESSETQLVKLDPEWWDENCEKIKEFIDDIQKLQSAEGDSLLDLVSGRCRPRQLDRSPPRKKRTRCLLDD